MKLYADHLDSSIKLQSNGATGKKRPQDQTKKEWLADFDKDPADRYREAKGIELEPKIKADDNRFFTGSTQDAITSIHQPIEYVAGINRSSPTTQLYFRYIDHRTTRQGSVAMDFETLDSEITATCFYNVKIESNRGNKYHSGKRGQFNPPKGGKFRKLWMQAVGKKPLRWSRVHKSMRSQLREIVCTGEISNELDSRGNHYYKLRNVQPRR